MSELIKYKGRWWLPNDNHNSIPGILNYNLMDGASLELFGILPYENPRKIEIIHGCTSHGTKITLYSCFQTKRSVTPTIDLNHSTIYANVIFDGIHFESLEGIKFSEISFHCSNLDEWTWTNGFDIDDSENNVVKIEYKLPPPIKVNVNEDYELVLNPITSRPEICLVQNEAIIRQKIYVKIINRNLQSFEEHFKKIRHIRNFLSLGVGKAVGIIEIFGTVEVYNNENGEIVNFSKIRIYNSILQEYYHKKIVFPPNMLFNFRMIEKDFDKYLNNWENKKELLDEVFNLYFSTIYNPKMYYEQVFLNFMHAIESYHRKSTSNAKIEDSEHKIRIKSILESVDEEYRPWLKEKLCFSNEPTLVARLREIINNEIPFISSIIDSNDDFIKKIRDTRNYLTHFDKSLKNKSATGIELIEINSKLKIIIEYYFLIEIGFEASIANDLIVSNNPNPINFLGLY